MLGVCENGEDNNSADQTRLPLEQSDQGVCCFDKHKFCKLNALQSTFYLRAESEKLLKF